MKNPYFNLISTVWHYGARWRFSIVGYYIALIVAQIALGLSPYIFGRAVDVLQHFSPARLMELIMWLLMDVGVLLLFWAFHGPARIVERKVALRVQQDFRQSVYEKLTHLPLQWHQNHHSGNVFTRFFRAATALRQFGENQFTYAQTIVMFLMSVGFLLWISLPIGLFSLATSVIVMWIVIVFDRRLIPLYDKQNEIDNGVGAILFDYITNMTTVLTLRLGKLTHNHFIQRMMAVWPAFRKDVALNEVKWFSMMVFLSIVQAILLIGYIVHALHATGALMIGTVVMMFRYQLDLGNVFKELSSKYSELVRMDTDIRGIEPILEDIKQLAHIPAGEQVARQWHTLHISELVFYHAGSASRHIFNKTAFSVKRGEKIALIGLSGGGKSTLLNIISGLYVPASVHLAIDGISFDSLEPLRAITTLIPQDPEIFENTIAFNITMDLETTDSAMLDAAKLAGFLAVLETLPLGFETDIREKGLNLSVGQKQRLALARGLFAARFSSLILMDEPTSSVDLFTEKEILSGVIHAFPDAAMIVSLHRLHLLPLFDSIIMLSEGGELISGSTADLLNHPGPVYDLWKAYQQ